MKPTYENPANILERAVTSCEARIENWGRRPENNKRAREIEVQKFLLEAAKYYYPWYIKTLSEELAQKYPVTFEPWDECDGEGWYAASESFPGIMGDGCAKEWAERDLRSVVADVIANRLNQGKELPDYKENIDW